MNSGKWFGKYRLGLGLEESKTVTVILAVCVTS